MDRNRQEQMKQMIRREIQSISSLEERVILKELMEGVFLSLYETNEQMYQQLEDRVMKDLAYDVNQLLIKTGLVEREYLDATHHFMTVMKEEDWKQSEHSVQMVRQIVAKEGRCLLGTVFLKCDLLDIRNVLEKKEEIQGTIKTTEEYPVRIQLEPNRAYLSEVEHLYHMFMSNGIPWQTVNCPYLFKMVDVYVIEISAGCQDKDIIESFKIDLDKLSSSVCYDVVPIWNVWHYELNSIGFAVACKDHKSYEHTISISDYGEDYIYMIDEISGVSSVRQSKQQIIITSQQKKAKVWKVYSIRNGREGRVSQYTYPVMENLRADGFAERFQRKTGQVVKSKGELERYIRGFGLEEYLEYQDCVLTEQTELAMETYSMNFFMKDEIRKDKYDTKLILIFCPKEKDSWLLRDLMSFIVSEVQELYPEYECGGTLQ